MNGYELHRNWFNFSFENNKAKPIHTAIYMYAIEHCNKLGWKKEFGFPTQLVMEILGIKSYNTYIKALNDLVDFGFISMVEKSKNQWTSNVIALSNFNEAHNKALDKATAKHTPKQLQGTHQSTHQSIDSINKHINYKTNKQINKQTKEVCDFEKLVRKYFSQTTEVLKMRLSGFLRSLNQNGELEEFKKQTIAYISYKQLSGEKNHSWNGFQSEWQSSDWIDKLKKLNKIEIKKEQKIHSNR